MYKPSYLFDPEPQERRRDIFKSWARDDQSFFAAGACHILANLFVQLHSHEGFEMIHIKPGLGYSGNHVYASNGEWAFDHNGWTKEEELLRVVEKEYSEHYKGWSYEKVVIEHSATALEIFCKNNNHRLPWQYAQLPWERAYNYIKMFPAEPQNKAFLI